MSLILFVIAAVGTAAIGTIDLDAGGRLIDPVNAATTLFRAFVQFLHQPDLVFRAGLSVCLGACSISQTFDDSIGFNISLGATDVRIHLDSSCHWKVWKNRVLKTWSIQIDD